MAGKKKNQKCKNKNKHKKSPNKKQPTTANTTNTANNKPKPQQISKADLLIEEIKSKKNQDLNLMAWPHFAPFDEELFCHFDKLYQMESIAAVRFKELGNEAYKNRKYEAAIYNYKKALSQFTNLRGFSYGLEKQFLDGFLMGTKCGGSSPVSLLSLSDNDDNLMLVKKIHSYLVSPDVAGVCFTMIPRRLVAEIYGNMSVVYRALGEIGLSYLAAGDARAADYSYEKADALFLKSLETGVLRKLAGYSKTKSDRFVEDMRNKFARIHKQSTTGLKSRLFGMIANAQIFVHPLQYSTVEQSVMRENIRRLRKINGVKTNEFVKAQLRVSLVPFSPTGEPCGIYISMSLFPEGIDHEGHFVDVYISSGWDISNFFLTQADPKHGDDVELPPNGRATIRALVETLSVIPQVIYYLKEYYRMEVTQLLMGQGLTEVTNQKGMEDEDGFLKKDPSSMSHFEKEMRGRIIMYRNFREKKLGNTEEAKRLWKFWDKFTKKLLIYPATSTYASEKAAGYHDGNNRREYGMSELRPWDRISWLRKDDIRFDWNTM